MKIDKKFIRELANYLKNRPEEAATIRDALFSSAQLTETKSETTWISAVELGKMIGLSSTRVRREYTGTVFNHFTRMGAKNAYRYDKEASLKEWDSYHQRMRAGGF